MTLVYLAIAWTAGLFVSFLLHEQGVLSCATPGWFYLLVAGISLPWLCLAPREARGRLVAGLWLFFGLGAWRYHMQPFSPCLAPADLAYYHAGQTEPISATLEGVVVEYPDVRDGRIQYRLAAATLFTETVRRPVQGDVLVEAERFPVYAYGDRLRVTGLLQTPPRLDGFDYERYLAQKGIHTLLRRAQTERLAQGEGNWLRSQLFRGRTRLSAILNRVLPEPAASLANGMLLGIESGIPTDVDDAFKLTGSSHVIVISGSNIALFSGVLMAWATRALGRRRAALPVIGTIAAYVVLIGADAAAFRAGVMGGLLVLAAFFGRRNTAYVSLCAAGLVLTAVNPLTLWDLGFQLSFLATLGLILFTRPLTGSLNRALRRLLPGVEGRNAGLLTETLVVTVAAQIMTAPVLLHSFGRFSPVSLVVNLLIVPVQPLILAGGFATLAAGLLWEPLARIVAVLPWLFLQYTVAVVRAAARLPFASVDVGASGSAWAVLIVSVVVGALAWQAWRRSAVH